MVSKLNDPNFGSRDYDPSRPEDKSKLNDPNFGAAKTMDSKERAMLVSEYNAKRRESKEKAEGALDAISKSQQGRNEVLSLIGKGGALGRRIEREIKRYESTGRISKWLADSAISGDLKNISNEVSKNASNRTLAAQPSKTTIELSTVPPFKFQKERLEIPQTEKFYPWDIYIKDADRDNNGDATGYTLGVIPATVFSILPSNWDSEWRVGTQTQYGIIKIRTDGRLISSLSIDFSSSPPQRQTPKKFGIESSIEILFGIFNDGASSNVLSRSINPTPRLYLVTSANPPAAIGESPFDLWYVLSDY